jgi:hypothetical protein
MRETRLGDCEDRDWEIGQTKLGDWETVGEEIGRFVREIEI